MEKGKMPEDEYRISRVCRVLGNPTALLALCVLGRRRLTPGELSREMKVSVWTVSHTLRKLRAVDLVRYETQGRRREYWVKDEKVLAFLEAGRRLVKKVRRQRF